MERAGSVGSSLWIIKGDSSLHINHVHSRCPTPSKTVPEANSLESKHSSNPATSSGYHGDIVSKEVADKDILLYTKSHKRRFYILFLFSLLAFMQYCCWNTFGPISTTCMAVFGWTEKEIAVMASLDPITYLLTMVWFSWLMDVKGLRLSMIVSSFFMALGCGLRCITSDKGFATWSIGAGQFLNGLAGPVTQAAPPLLSASWFPSDERTTATALAALCGSLGVAGSFLISPMTIKEINLKKFEYTDPYSANSSLKLLNKSAISTSRLLAETVFKDAKHYWPMDNELSQLHSMNYYFHQKNKTNPWKRYIQLFQNYKNKYSAFSEGKVVVPNGVNGRAVTTAGKKGWLNLGDFSDECFGKPSICKNGFTVSFWVNFLNSSLKRQFLLGTAGSKIGRHGFLVGKLKIENQDYLNIKVASSNLLWSAKVSAVPLLWHHVTIAWNSTVGMFIYINGTLRFSTSSYKEISDVNVDEKFFTVGKVNDKNLYCSASFDEIALWEEMLTRDRVDEIFYATANNGKSTKQRELERELDEVIAERREDIMNLLYIEFAITIALFVLVLLYFPDKPPHPPSLSAHQERDDFKHGAKKLFKSPQFWTLCVIYGLTTGVYSGWGAVLNVNLSSFGISQKDAGWLGFYTVLAGIGAGMILARCADMFSGKMKLLLLLLFFGATGSFLWFCLLCLRMIPFSKEFLYKAAILGGFFVSGTIPLFYELTIEQTYPISEGITTGILTIANNLVTVLFLIVLMIPNVGTSWMNWVLFGSCAICLPILIMFREKYKRLNIDLGSGNNTSDNEKNLSGDVCCMNTDSKKVCLKAKDAIEKTFLNKQLNLTLRIGDDIGASLWSLPNPELDKLLQKTNKPTNIKEVVKL